MEKNLIFGYGSLILEEDLKFIPVKVKGLKRGWFLNIPKDRTMALAIIKDKDFYCNGVILEVSKEKISEFDKREGGYQRILLEKDSISSLNNEKIPRGNIWVYEIKKPQKAKFNIIQSYLDVVLTGYLNINKDFAEEFLNTTYRWRKIKNDRASPRYPRHLKILKRKKEIDELIKTNLKNAN